MATQPVDGRKGADSLMVLVREAFRHDPLSGHLFIFFSKRCDRVRIVYWDRNGFAMWTGAFSSDFLDERAPIVGRDRGRGVGADRGRHRPRGGSAPASMAAQHARSIENRRTWELTRRTSVAATRWLRTRGSLR